MVYIIQEIWTLLRSQPEDAKRWLTTSQMGWALTREDNEVTKKKDEREGKPVARQLAPMISNSSGHSGNQRSWKAWTQTAT